MTVKTEKVRLDVWLRVLIIGVPVVTTASVISTEYAHGGSMSAVSLVGILFCTALMIVMGFAAHWAEFSEDEVRLRWAPIYASRIQRASITNWSVSDEPVSPWKYGGIGLRLASRGTLALVNRKGRVLEFETSENRRYVITLFSDEEVAMVRREMSLREHS
jgi:hypothetical protein